MKSGSRSIEKDPAYKHSALARRLEEEQARKRAALRAFYAKDIARKVSKSKQS